MALAVATALRCAPSISSGWADVATVSVLSGRDPSTWQLRQPFGPRVLAVVLVAVVVLGVTGQRVEIDRLVRLTWEWAMHAVGLAPTSQVGRGLGRVGETLFPLQIAERTDVTRI